MLGRVFTAGQPRRTHRRRRGARGALTELTGAAMLVTGAAMLAACGSSSSTTTSATTAGAHASLQHASTGTREANASASTQTASASAALARAAPGCRPIASPAPKLGLQVQPPTSHLDPDRTYTVTLKTNCGDIKIALAVHQAPTTAASFAHLVETGFYNDLTFHRVVPGFVIQGGDPHGDGTGGPGYQVVEAPPADLQYTNGVVAMAKTETDPSGASGSQFFIVVGANVHLPAEYALVGHVVGGDDAVHRIASVPTDAGPNGERGSTPAAPVVIEQATVTSS